MRKTPLFLLASVLFAACSNTSPSSINENEVIGNQVSVEFLSQAEAWSTEEVVTQNKDFYLQHEPDYMKVDATQSDDDYLKSLYTLQEGMTLPLINFWKVGTIQNGTYVGQSLVLVSAQCDGPCPNSIFRYAVDETTNHWTGLVPYSDTTMGSEALQGPGTDLEASIDIPVLDTPDTLNLFENDPVAMTGLNLVQDPNYFGITDENFASAYLPMQVTGDNSFQKYYQFPGTACVFGETPDGILVRYQTMPVAFGFADPADGKGNYAWGQPIESADFSLLLSDGSEVTKEEHTYALTAGGCGFLGGCALTYDAGTEDETSLVELGTITRPSKGSNVGETVYTLSAVQTGAENELSMAVQSAYDSYTMAVQYKDPPETAMSMDDFLSKHMVVLIKMDDGRYTLAYDSTVAPAAECGKPVIYLYPETAQEVSVQVNNITFSKTVPAYGNGWTVWANPSGLLTNLADNKNYPYLFWEGQSSSKMALGSAWTLAKKDIAAELPKALTGMGLNAKEAADFMEFWLPKLEAVKAPYIQFNFEGTAAMNQVAPLSITPAPDSLLRVFMFYQGVSKAGLSMPAYTAPARHGFSVVEWGGSLY